MDSKEEKVDTRESEAIIAVLNDTENETLKGRLNISGICENGTNPMFALEEEALSRAGISRERAFAIDQSNIALIVEGFAFQRLADRFFARVFSDKNDWFRCNKFF